MVEEESSNPTHRARAIVAIEMPVDPTVPSKIREPVYGRKSPSLSASSITSRGQSTRRRAFSNPTVGHTSECDTILDATPGVEILRKRKMIDYQKTASPYMPHTGRTSAFPRISTPNALLNELIRTSGVFPLRGAQIIPSVLEGTEPRTDDDTYQSSPSLHPAPRRSAILWGSGRPSS
jgi:hypothetical protein